MSAEGIPRFTNAEMARRHHAGRKLMEEHGLDALLVFGHSGRRRHNQADVYYLSQCAPQHESYLLMPAKGDPTLFVTHHNHLASARDVSSIVDVRRAHKRPGHQLVAEIRQRGLASARIGLVGTFFYQDVDGLRAELSGATLKDVSEPFRLIRLTKSEEELAFQRKASAGCDAIIAAFTKEIRPGLEERDLLVMSEEVAWRAGCEPDFLYLSSTPMKASRYCVPNQNVSRRKLVAGDAINTELTVAYGLYSSQILRCFFLGEPTAEYERIRKVMVEAYERMRAVCVPGRTAQDIHEASGWIEAQGLTTVDGVAHGFGIDLLPPSIRSPSFDPPAPLTLRKNMTLVLQPNPTTKDELMGLQIGDMGLITDDGYMSMHATQNDVIRL